jgi:hypothetical protein
VIEMSRVRPYLLRITLVLIAWTAFASLTAEH